MKYKFLLAALAIGFLSCDKGDDPDPTPAPTKTEMLTVSAWKYDNGGADSNGDGTIDFTFEQTGTVPACRLDNTATFSTNGTGTTNEGATKCNAGDPQTTDFTWNFVNNQTAIFVTGSGFFGFGGVFQIKSLTTTGFTVTKDTVINVGVPMAVTVIANMKH